MYIESLLHYKHAVIFDSQKFFKFCKEKEREENKAHEHHKRLQIQPESLARNRWTISCNDHNDRTLTALP